MDLGNSIHVDDCPNCGPNKGWRWAKDAFWCWRCDKRLAHREDRPARAEVPPVLVWKSAGKQRFACLVRPEEAAGLERVRL